MKILVCGGRDYRDRQKVYDELDHLASEHGVSLVIEGGQRTRDAYTGKLIGGADAFAAEWAIIRGVAHKVFPADWKAHGRAAGPIRNREMLVHGQPDLVIAFPGGRGTSDMVHAARAAGVKVVEVA